MRTHLNKKLLAQAAGVAVCSVPALSTAATFENEWVRGSFVSTLAVGTGIRASDPSCNLVMSGVQGDGVAAGCLAPTAGIADQGNLNYGNGDPFTAYLKGTHELVLKFSGETTFMARGTWIRDFAATHTTGLLSAQSPVSLPDEAASDLRFKARLLDFWVSKSFSIGEQRARVKLGNQVLNWGESLFAAGGINATNAMDLQRLALPGTQIKEVLLAAPMASMSMGLGNGVDVEGYYQFDWNKSYIPPVGSYWSTSTALGVGNDAYGVAEQEARKRGQWGLSVRWQPDNLPASFGFYALRYHDKLPVLQIDQATFAQRWLYPEDRKLYGLSVNFPLGDWAIGSEVSYRPKDAVALNPNLGCMAREGRCWIDERRWQWSVNGIFSLTPSNATPFLEMIGASTGSLLAEVVMVRYPGLRDSYDGDPLAAGYSGWGQEFDPAAARVKGGTRTSSGLAFDFSVTYDGTLLSGWQVVPGVYYAQALNGRTPSLTAPYLRGAKSANFYVNFIRNPASWQVGLNYTKLWGGDSPLDNTLRDRDYVGLNASYSF